MPSGRRNSEIENDQQATARILKNAVDMRLALEYFDSLLLSCSKRTQLILNAYKQSFPNDLKFIVKFFHLTGKNVRYLKHVGQKTADEILSFREKFFNNPCIYLGQIIPLQEEPFSPPEGIDKLFPLVECRLALLSTRAKNGLSNFFKEHNNSLLEWYSTVSSPSFKVKQIKNIGKGTQEEVYSFINDTIAFIRQFTSEDSIEESLKNFNSSAVHIEQLLPLKEESFSPPENIDKLFPLVECRLGFLSVRAKNGLTNFFKEHNNSLREWYSTVSSPSFKVEQIRNIGKGTKDEVQNFISDTITFIRQFTSEDSIEDALKNFSAHTLDELQIPEECQAGIHELENTLGHFPLFAALKAYFKGLEGEDRTIIDGLFIIHEDQVLRERDEVAAELNLSPERVRQKRNKLVDSMAGYFAFYRTLGFVDECPYNYQMRRINEDINAEEGTDFNLNFINWVLASAFDEVTLLGDVAKTITGYYDKNYFLCLVPTELCQYMDFNAFLEDVETRLAEKRINEEKVNLQNLINAHLKTQYCEDEMPAIETACRSILYLHYPVEVDFGQVIFKPNARKNNPIVIEEIIRAAGHPLTLEEIYEEFIYQYPERYTEMNSFRGSIANNPNIVPIGRSSTYSLVEWTDGEHRGGTIRKFICEYLDSLDLPIASVNDITEYVLRFRPETSRQNILTNISLEKSGKFAQYIKNKERYIAFSGTAVDDDYVLLDESSKMAKSIAGNLADIKDFITNNGRAPVSSSTDPHELHLYRFIQRARKRVRENNVNESERSEWISFFKEYKKYFDLTKAQKDIWEEVVLEWIKLFKDGRDPNEDDMKELWEMALRHPEFGEYTECTK